MTDHTITSVTSEIPAVHPTAAHVGDEQTVRGLVEEAITDRNHIYLPAVSVDASAIFSAFALLATNAEAGCEAVARNDEEQIQFCLRRCMAGMAELVDSITGL